MTKQSDLIAYLFEEHLQHRDETVQLSGDLLQWMDASSRFTAFVDTYRDKIRKKIRVIREPESIFDLRSELKVAYCLLGDRRMAVVYEPVASTKRRGPDFSVTYRDNLIFNIEVARMRADESGAGWTGFERAGEPARKEDRVLRILLNKLGQMQPGMGNLLVIHTQAKLAQSIDLAALMQDVKTRVESKAPSFLAASRYANPAAFYKDLLRLSGILLWGEDAQLWVNKQARPGLDGKVSRLVAFLLQSRTQMAGEGS